MANQPFPSGLLAFLQGKFPELQNTFANRGSTSVPSNTSATPAGYSSNMGQSGLVQALLRSSPSSGWGNRTSGVVPPSTLFARRGQSQPGPVAAPIGPWGTEAPAIPNFFSAGRPANQPEQVSSQQPVMDPSGETDPYEIWKANGRRGPRPV